jgi:hypothetical protein
MYKNSPAHKQDRFADETPQQIAWHRDIAAKYARRQKRSNHFLARLRIGELVRLFKDRYRSDQLPDDDAGRPDLRLLLDHAAQIGPEIARQWAMKLMPSLDDDDSLDDLLKEVGTGRRWDADDLARAVGLEDARRARLRIKTIGATDCGKAQRLTRRKRNRNAADRARRAKSGATPRAQSVERAAPWIEAGISRRTYYNRKKCERDCTDCTETRPILSSSSIGLEPVPEATAVTSLESHFPSFHHQEPSPKSGHRSHCGPRKRAGPKKSPLRRAPTDHVERVTQAELSNHEGNERRTP